MDEEATSSTATASAASNIPSALPPGPDPSLPPAVIVLGMAGSGKTSFVQRLTAHLHARKTPPYVVNLDPAVSEVPYPANVDIRDTVRYKDVQLEYGLGPNGAIMTSLNLFATRFDQVVSMVRRRATDPGYSLAIFDTPGQIEAFTWSASGQIITDALASSQPCVVAYVVDAARATNPSLSLVLDEFYKDLRTVATSALTGEGMDDFLKAVQEAVVIYQKEYVPAYEKAMVDRQAKQEAMKHKEVEEARKDVEVMSLDPRAVPVLERIHLGGVEEENDEDANIARP